MGRLLPACSAFTNPPSSSELRTSSSQSVSQSSSNKMVEDESFDYDYDYDMAINTAHPGYGLSCCHGSLFANTVERV